MGDFHVLFKPIVQELSKKYNFNMGSFVLLELIIEELTVYDPITLFLVASFFR